MFEGWSIRTRLTVIATSVMFVLCLGTSVLALVAIRSQAIDYQVERTTTAALKIVRDVKRDTLPQQIPQTGELAWLDGVQVIDARGRTVAGTQNLGSTSRISTLTPPEDNTRAAQIDCSLPVFPACEIIVVFRVYEPEGDWFVYAFAPDIPWYVDARFLSLLLLACMLLIGLTSVGTARTVSRALKPVNDIRREAMRIALKTAGDDSRRRIALPRHGDELRALAISANEALDRLDESLRKEREFTSNASHDLRSPITAMRAELDAAMMYPDETDWPVTAEKLSGSLDRLQALVDDLLELARLDAGQVPRSKRLDLAELVRAEILRRPEDSRITVEAEPAEVFCHPLHLSRLFNNLLDNAERHAEKVIDVRVGAEGDRAVLEVYNDGDTIPPRMREAVFDRFTRLDASRSKDTGGTGLGLAIVREIANAHRGDVRVGDSETGARFIVRLPLAR
ncbi:HAMP domain-containing sensor histidine kinase [Actinocorallia sp. B10E7]|uniref:sensor histidine kinase n=1 Tax=Actinocorallia sp. B10E7 TaxID=3153558 RepID=UPI00325D63A9